MLRGPKCLTRWVDLSSNKYPENGLLAGLGWAFSPKSPFEVPKKLHLFMLRGPRIKTLPSCSLGFHEYEMDNASNFKRDFTPDSNLKRGNEIGFYLCKRAKAKNSVISYLGVPTVRNDQCKQCQGRLHP